MNSRDRKLDIEVVLVCDAVSDDDDEAFAFSTEGDRPTIESFDLISSGLNDTVRQVIHYSNLPEFIDNLHAHREAIVFPYWFGELSRSRHSLVPAICEAAGIPYVGADAYTQSVCNDKFLSKSLCASAGLTTAEGILLSTSDDLGRMETSVYPVVIKPNFQGSSLGIDDRCLAHSFEEAKSATQRIVKHFGWPVLCEKFVPGREVSICVMGDHLSKPQVAMLSWSLNDDPSYLDERLFSYSLKYLADVRFSPNYLGEPEVVVRRSCELLFRMLDKVEVLRIDGRLTQNGFVVIELSPDLDLRPDGEVAIAFGQRLGSYQSFLKQLLLNSFKRAGRETPMDYES